MYPRIDRKHRASRCRSRSRSDDFSLATAQHPDSDTLEKGHMYHQGHGKSPFTEMSRRAIIPSSETKLMPGWIFVDKGMLPVQYLHNSAQLIPEGLQAVERQRSVHVICGMSVPSGETPTIPSQLQGGPGMPARGQRSCTLISFLLHRPFSRNLQTLLLCSATCLPGKHESLVSSFPSENWMRQI